MLFLRKHHERVIGGSSGKEDGESKTYQASHLDAQTVTLNSQSDTNLIGSQVAGNKVNANVGGKLNIESLQDEERFKTKSSGGGLEVEFGFGNNWSLSGYGNASKGTTHRKQVNEQAGIFAEEGGYHINADSVHLKGGAIASTNPKNSELATSKLTFEDIQNESSSKAASASVSGSIKESKEKWVDNETGRAVKPNTENSTKLDSQRSGGLSPGLPMFERDSDSSVTRATLTEGTIILNKDTHPTVTTAKELGINTDLAQANNQVAQTKDVKAQIQEQQQISAAIGNVKSAVDTYTSNKQEEAEQEVRRLKSRLEKAEQQGNQETVNQLKKDLMQAEAQAENWGTGGSTKRAVDAITNAGLIALSGGSSQSIATAVASPYVNQLIKKATEDYPALNIPTHILWGAVEAELMGGKASTGAISTAAGELGAKYLTEHLYHKEAKDLTETERSQVKEMAKALAGVAGGLAAAGQGASAVKILSESSIGTTVANNAVENNYLWQEEQKEFEKKMLECKSKGEDCTSVVNEYLDKSNKRSRELYDRCKDGGVRCAGMEEVIDVSTNIARAKYDTSGRLFLGDALQDDDTIKIVNYVNERDLTFLKDRVSATDRMLYQASDITNWPFLLLGARNLLANNSRSAFVSAGIGMGANAGVQYYFNKDVDVVDVVSAGALGKITAGKSYATTVNSNMVGSYYTGKIKGGSDSDSAYDSIVSGVASKVGYRSGNLVENKLDPIFNPVSNKYKWNDLGYGISFQEGVNPLPSRLGNMADSIASEAINKPLSKDEKK